MITVGHQRAPRKARWLVWARAGIVAGLLPFALTDGVVVASLVQARGCDASAPLAAHPVASRILPTPVTGRPSAIAMAENDESLFVSLESRASGSPGGIQVFRRAGDGLRSVGIIPLRSGATGLALSADGRALLAALEDGVALLEVSRASTGDPTSLLGYASTGPGAGTFSVTTAGSRYVLTADRAAGRVTVLNLLRMEYGDLGPSVHLGTIDVDMAPSGLAASPDGRYLYVVSQVQRPVMSFWPSDRIYGTLTQTNFLRRAGTLSVIDMKRVELDPATAVVARVPAGCQPVQVAASPDGRTVWVAARQSNELLAFSTEELLSGQGAAPLARVPVAASPVGLRLLRGGRFALVAGSTGLWDSSAPETVSVVETSAALAGRQAVRTSITVGGFSGDIGVTADQRMAYVANMETSALTALDLSDLLG